MSPKPTNTVVAVTPVAPTFTQAERDAMMAEMAALKTQLAEAKATGGRKIHFKVSEKGGVSVYGFGRFPVTLYGEQFIALANVMPDLLKFIEENKAKLSTKESKKAAALEVVK